MTTLHGRLAVKKRADCTSFNASLSVHACENAQPTQLIATDATRSIITIGVKQMSIPFSNIETGSDKPPPNIL